MRKTLILPFLIIILVAVSWFRPAFCQSSDKDKQLIEFYAKQKAKIKNIPSGGSYSSPNIYGEEPEMLVPGESILHAEGDTILIISRDTTELLEPFGYGLFRMPSELSPPSEVADASDYILGPGDNIIIYTWGKVEKEYNLTVDRQGKIFIPKIGGMVVWGLTLEEFESRITGSLSRVYADFKVSVSLGKIRSIRIYLTGEVKRPGAYTVSSLTTLFNALYLAGGPNIRGSMRDIKLIRNNKLEAAVDLYQFLLKGDSRGDVKLSSGDAIFVPVSGPRITIGGEVKRPAIYELMGGETVSQLLELAGGPTAEAYLDRIMLDRISPNDEREVIDINLNPINGDIDEIELIDGDILTVFSVYEMKRNVVAIAGMVKHPGQFERTDSTTVKMLIERAELLPENVYYERANLFRRYADRRIEIIAVNLHELLNGSTDIVLQDLDSLHIYGIDEVEREKYVYINGEVKNPGKYRLYDNMMVSDLIFLAGRLNRNAYQVNVELARADSLGKVNLQSIDLTRPKGNQFRLQESDHIFVRRIPDWFSHRMITIEGEVRFPGRYALLSRDETLHDLIKRAGGFTENAFPKGTIFWRKSIGESLERKNLYEIVSNSQPLEEDSLGNIRKVELIKFNTANMNRIIIDMEKIISTDGVDGNLPLQSNDSLYVPEIPSGISVMGAVGANGTIKFELRKKVRYYIERAGNFTNQADKKGTRLIKADGRVFAGGGTLGKRVEIGDAVVVPIQIRKDHDWLKTLSTTLSVVGSVATSILIIDRL